MFPVVAGAGAAAAVFCSLVFRSQKLRVWVIWYGRNKNEQKNSSNRIQFGFQSFQCSPSPSGRGKRKDHSVMLLLPNIHTHTYTTPPTGPGISSMTPTTPSTLSGPKSSQIVRFFAAWRGYWFFAVSIFFAMWSLPICQARTTAPCCKCSSFPPCVLIPSMLMLNCCRHAQQPGGVCKVLTMCVLYSPRSLVLCFQIGEICRCGMLQCILLPVK